MPKGFVSTSTAVAKRTRSAGTAGARTRVRWMLVLGAALTGAALIACSDDPASRLGQRGSSGPGNGATPDGDGGIAVEAGGPAPEEVLFRAVESELQKKCGGACHTDATYKPTPPAFLAGPDAYKSVKAAPGIIVADYFQSALLQKGAHAGPAINVDPTFEAKVIEWLKMEAALIQAKADPTTDPVALVQGANDIDLSKACIGGLSGVHLKLEASVVGGILAFSDLKVVAPAGTDVHILKPRFIRVLAKPDESNRTEIPDGAETFSNTDQTVPGGAETALAPGYAFMTASGWSPYDFATDKIRIEFEKLEPGKVSVVEQPKVCKNVAMFTANVLPALRGGAGITPNCATCHGNGLAGLSLNSGDQATVCNQVLLKLNEANIGQSLIVNKVTAGPHNGGLVNDAANFRAVFVNNAAVFF